MSYEVQFQHEGAEYKVIGPDIDGLVLLIQGLQDLAIVPHIEERRDAAEATLKGLKYEWRGGELWAPPIGAAPAFLDATQSGWIDWAGGEQPAATLGKHVWFTARRGDQAHHPADGLYWEHRGMLGDIVRYRVCE